MNELRELAERNFYVAPCGNDSWSGRLPQARTDGTDGPFASLTRARDAVRDLLAAARGGSAGAPPDRDRDRGTALPSDPNAGARATSDGIVGRGPRDGSGGQAITVLVRGGRHYLREPLCLEPGDSGARGRPVTYTAYPGEEPILSGGLRLTNWEPHAGPVLRCPLPDEVQGELARFRQLFCNGQRQPRARWPKPDPEDPIGGGWAFAEGAAEQDSHDAFVYLPGTFRHRWARCDQVEVNIFPHKGWCNCIVPIASVDADDRVIHLAHKVWDVRTVAPWYWSMPLAPGNRFCVENALEALDQPGEWCLDLVERLVYFWPPEETTQDMEVVLPALGCLIDIKGASHITLRGLTLTESTSGDNMHRTGLEGYGAQLPTPGWPYVARPYISGTPNTSPSSPIDSTRSAAMPSTWRDITPGM